VAKDSPDSVKPTPEHGLFRYSRLLISIQVVLVSLLVVSCAVAGDPGSVVSLQFENDVLGIDDSDMHYTNGLQLSWQSGHESVPDWLASWATGNFLFGSEAYLQLKLALGHNVYTPEDLKTPELIEDDRPYAGWLHGDFTLMGRTGEAMNVLEVSLGIVGPSAGGYQLQKWFHEIIDSPDPVGWQNQLHDELALLVGFERRWRNIIDLGFWGLEIDPAPHLGASLGNVFTYGSAGGNLRLGQGLASDFGPPRLRPGSSGSSCFRGERNLSWYFFAGTEGRLVLHNIFLDGNTFGSSHHVAKETYVLDTWVGWSVALKRFRISANYIMRSKEFQTQDKPDHFGAVTFSAGF